MNSCSPFQGIRVRRGVGLVPGAVTEAPTLEAGLDQERGKDQGAHAAVREDAGVVPDRETERDEQEAGQRKEEAEQRDVGLAVVAAAGQEGGDTIRDHPAMTVVSRTGRESKGMSSVQ